MLFSTLNYITKFKNKTYNQPQRENNLLCWDLTGPSITMRGFAITSYGGVRSGVAQKQVQRTLEDASRKASLAGARHSLQQYCIGFGGEPAFVAVFWT